MNLSSRMTETPGALSLSGVRAVLELRGLQVLARLPADAIVPLACHVTDDRFDAGAMVYRQGQTADRIGFLVSGGVEILRSGRAVVELDPGDILGEAGLLDVPVHLGDAVAVSDCRVLWIDREAFHEMLDLHPGFQRAILDALCARLRRPNS